MTAKPTQNATPDEAQGGPEATAAMACWGRSSEPLVLKLREPELTWQGLLSELVAVGSERMTDASTLVLDFSAVEQWVSPWTVHVALLVELSRKTSLCVRGLHGQPLGVIWLYRSDPDVRKTLAPLTHAPQQRAA